ncbi:MAG: aspartate/glutamate racemase family protein [Granulosicoccus sp.]
MKTIGLIGGMSWESTVSYYQQLNILARQRLGGLHSANLLLWSFDFAEIEACQARGDWQEATRMMIVAATSLEQAGAQCIVICTNTMHKMAAEVQEAIDIPLIHIADATAASIKASHVKRPLLLATAYTMEQDFYTGRLMQQHSINVATPSELNRVDVHRIIYDELCQGVIKEASKKRYLEIIAEAECTGVDGVIFGCTEVGLLIQQADTLLPVFDTTSLHAKAAMDFALT